MACATKGVGGGAAGTDAPATKRVRGPRLVLGQRTLRQLFPVAGPAPPVGVGGHARVVECAGFWQCLDCERTTSFLVGWRAWRIKPCSRIRVAAAARVAGGDGHVWEHTSTHVGCRVCGRKSLFRWRSKLAVCAGPTGRALRWGNTPFFLGLPGEAVEGEGGDPAGLGGLGARPGGPETGPRVGRAFRAGVEALRAADAAPAAEPRGSSKGAVAPSADVPGAALQAGFAGGESSLGAAVVCPSGSAPPAVRGTLDAWVRRRAVDRTEAASPALAVGGALVGASGGGGVDAAAVSEAAASSSVCMGESARAMP